MLLTLELGLGMWSASRPGRFMPEERASGTYWVGGLVGLRVVLDEVEKRKMFCPCRESNQYFLAVYPVASRYAD
jgi:hypothetical protein